MLVRLILLALLGCGAVLEVAVAPVAHADGSVGVANDADGTATIDPQYATELRVSGSGFQSISGGHGGIYVFFGTVRGVWRPSQGGTSGTNYLYVPDTANRNNRGYQAYVAFPGSDTGSSAQGQMTSSGRWSVTLTVPGATFQAVGRDGTARTVDCRRETCGIITVGAHGVVNARNESFTPVRVADLYDAPPAGTDTSAEAPAETSADTSASSTGPRRLGPVRLEIDRASATAGHVLPFVVHGITPGAQVSAVLDDGVAAAGPFLVGVDGRATGVVTLPADLGAGTHELRIFGLGADVKAPRIRFPVAAADVPAAVPVATPTTAEPSDVSPAAEETRADSAGPWFFAASVVVLLLALGRLVVSRRRSGRAPA